MFEAAVLEGMCLSVIWLSWYSIYYIPNMEHTVRFMLCPALQCFGKYAYLFVKLTFEMPYRYTNTTHNSTTMCIIWLKHAKANQTHVHVLMDILCRRQVCCTHSVRVWCVETVQCIMCNLNIWSQRTKWPRRQVKYTYTINIMMNIYRHRGYPWRIPYQQCTKQWKSDQQLNRWPSLCKYV